MKFTTPCFVCVDDAEERDALIDWCARIGYQTNKWKLSPKVRYVFCGADFAGRCGEKALASLTHNSIDCGTDIELFKALAAMNDENDREQWFISDTYANIGCVSWYLCYERKFKHYYVEWEDGRTDIRSNFCKATAEEIVEHFKSRRQ